MYKKLKCFLHFEEEYKFICLENHNCEIKFCVEFFSKHRPQRYETIKEFLKQSSKIFSSLEENQNIDHKFKIIKKNVANSKSLNQIQYQTLLKILDSLQQDLKTLNSDFFKIKQKLLQKNIESFSNTELKTLTEIRLTDQISIQNSFIEICISKIFHNVEELVKQLQHSNPFILSKISSKNEIVEQQELCELMEKGKKRKVGKISLIGEKKFGMLHGQYYYQIENNEKVYKKGGMYFLDQKIGQWCEINQNVLLEGQYRHGKKVGKWKQNCNGQSFQCQYNNVGQKHGKCQDILVLVQNNGYIIQSGYYNEAVRINEWEIYYLNKANSLSKIGGGKYDEKGQKIGKWLDINESKFNLLSQILWQGEYQAGVKVGEWKIKFRSDDQADFKQIGGGKYDEKGQKIGKWLHINESLFTQNNQYLFQGQYVEGVKYGKWKISYRLYNSKDFRQIGGGKYDDQGQKIGKWIVVNESEFEDELLRDEQLSFMQILWQGEYKAGGVKVGEWKIKFRSDDQADFKQIGGGKYDKKGQKIGKWIDIVEGRFQKSSQILWQGEYQAGGVKVGEWAISFRNDDQADFKQIGGGKYDEQGQKIGKWIDIKESKFDFLSEILWQGEYQAGGIKVGEWKISCRLLDWADFKQIGGGQYDEQGQKIGKWIDINESKFGLLSPILFQGEYQAGSIKVGEWKISCGLLNQDFKQIGGGKYDDQGQKIGKWSDINVSEFNMNQQILWQGEYQAGGIKVGEWAISFRNHDQADFKQIGGGKYDDQGQKIGKWSDINVSEFNMNKQILWQGEYQAGGIKVGEWAISFRNHDQAVFKQIGGGKYDEQGQKIGKWIDIVEGRFQKSSQILWQGEYQAGGVKVGEWAISFRNHDQADFKQIGGGKYDEYGQKIGKWIDIVEGQFFMFNQKILQGEYQTGGVKIGEWKITKRRFRTSDSFDLFEIQTYDENGAMINNENYYQ